MLPSHHMIPALHTSQADRLSWRAHEESTGSKAARKGRMHDYQCIQVSTSWSRWANPWHASHHLAHSLRKTSSGLIGFLHKPWAPPGHPSHAQLPPPAARLGPRHGCRAAPLLCHAKWPRNSRLKLAFSALGVILISRKKNGFHSCFVKLSSSNSLTLVQSIVLIPESLAHTKLGLSRTCQWF